MIVMMVVSGHDDGGNDGYEDSNGCAGVDGDGSKSDDDSDYCAYD